jgi:phosphoribosylanthranilate isomerase
VNLGVHYLGFNFYSQSPRKVSPELAARIVAKVPPFVPCVGVFVDQEVKDILKIVQKAGLMGVQLHGEQTPEDCRALREQLEDSVLLMKAFRVAQESDVEAMSAYQGLCSHFLLDARVEDQPGGTGQSFPWELAERAKFYRTPLFVAGGLTPENVREAIKRTQPFAVDVASGVEKSPKRKDYDKLKTFVEQVKRS